MLLSNHKVSNIGNNNATVIELLVLAGKGEKIFYLNISLLFLDEMVKGNSNSHSNVSFSILNCMYISYL